MAGLSNGVKDWLESIGIEIVEGCRKGTSFGLGKYEITQQRF